MTAGGRAPAGTRSCPKESPTELRLWPPELEALRDEARRVVRAQMAVLIDALDPDARNGREEPGKSYDLAAMRASFARFYAPVREAQDRTIAGVRCRVLRPDREPSAVYLHFHGGGMALGAPELNDVLNLDLCRRFGLATVSVDYRLAPEHPYPAGPDDGTAVAAWLVEHAADELGSPHLMVGGESAGGYMAAMVLLRLRDELQAAHVVLGAYLAFGIYDWGGMPSQRGVRPQDSPDLLEPGQLRFLADCYLPGLSDEERRVAAISPAFADLRGLPPAFMSVGGADHLLDDTLLLAARWAAAENEIELFVAPDLPHGFIAFPCEIVRRHAQAADAWFARRLAAEPGERHS